MLYHRYRREAAYHIMLFPAPAAKLENELICVKANMDEGVYDFHGATTVIRSSSILGM